MCDFAVCPNLVQEICENLEVIPQRDAFATKENIRFEKWYGEGSADGVDAFEETWGIKILWINPPFNVILRVL